MALIHSLAKYYELVPNWVMVASFFSWLCSKCTSQDQSSDKQVWVIIPSFWRTTVVTALQHSVIVVGAPALQPSICQSPRISFLITVGPITPFPTACLWAVFQTCAVSLHHHSVTSNPLPCKQLPRLLFCKCCVCGDDGMHVRWQSLYD